ncbi:MAG TPA: hypothetical protein C5S50_09440 [Methanosarcinaceae archaeon]|nr:hypothetical protein [Methanosarcinaceae archaeon]
MIDTTDEKPTMEEYFKRGVFIISMLLLFVATFQLYFSMENIIRTWLEYEYVSIFKAFYNLGVLLVCVYLIKLYIIKR